MFDSWKEQIFSSALNFTLKYVKHVCKKETKYCVLLKCYLQLWKLESIYVRMQITILDKKYEEKITRTLMKAITKYKSLKPIKTVWVFLLDPMKFISKRNLKTYLFVRKHYIKELFNNVLNIIYDVHNLNKQKILNGA